MIKFIKSKLINKILIIGYVELPPIKEIKLSFSSKLILSKNFFFNDINNQSKILKKFIESKNIKLLSQKNIFNEMLINYSDQNIKKEHKKIYEYTVKNSHIIRKIFSINLSQSLVMDGDRIITIEDIFGTNNMIRNQTLDLLIKFNFKAICLLHRNIIIANKSSFIENINKSKLSLIVI